MFKLIKNLLTKIGDEMRIEILLKEVRIRKNISLVRLSKKTGISKTHINDIENEIKEEINYGENKFYVGQNLEN